jgi:hypothetical protein
LCLFVPITIISLTRFFVFFFSLKINSQISHQVKVLGIFIHFLGGKRFHLNNFQCDLLLWLKKESFSGLLRHNFLIKKKNFTSFCFDFFLDKKSENRKWLWHLQQTLKKGEWTSISSMWRSWFSNFSFCCFGVLSWEN